MRARHRTPTFAIVGLAALTIAFGAASAAPSITRPVTDDAGVLSSSEVEAVAERLVALRERTGVQMAVLLVDTTSGVDIAHYAQQAFEAWGGGSAERDDGVLFVLAISDRRSRLHTGYGIEPAVPDAAAIRMLDDLRPALRAGDYGAASLQIVDAVADRVAHLTPGAAITAPSVPLAERMWPPIVVLLLGLALGFWRHLAVYGATAGKKRKKTGRKRRERSPSGKRWGPPPGAEVASSEDADVDVGADADIELDTSGIVGVDHARVWSAVAVWAVVPALVGLIMGSDSGGFVGVLYAALCLAYVGYGTLAGVLFREPLRRSQAAAFAGLLVVLGFFAVVFVMPSEVFPVEPTIVPAVYMGVGLVALFFAMAGRSGTGGGSWTAGGGGWSSGSSSSSWSSGSSSSSWSSSSSSSSWSGGGGSSGGGGASSSW